VLAAASWRTRRASRWPWSAESCRELLAQATAELRAPSDHEAVLTAPPRRTWLAVVEAGERPAAATCWRFLLLARAQQDAARGRARARRARARSGLSPPADAARTRSS
jgi:hypothetical protein